EAKRQKDIRQGTQRIDKIFGDQFTDDFFTGRQDAFTNYARPQLDDQFADARKKLTFALARSGTLDSTMRADKEAELQKLYDDSARNISDTALTQSNQARSDIEASRADLIKMLNSTGDVQGTVNSALTRAQALATPAAHSPLGPLFANFTAGLAQQNAINTANTYAP